MIQMKPLWYRECCSICGEEGLSTRSQNIPVTEKYICNECETYERGYQDGLKHAKEEMERTK